MEKFHAQKILRARLQQVDSQKYRQRTFFLGGVVELWLVSCVISESLLSWDTLGEIGILNKQSITFIPGLWDLQQSKPGSMSSPAPNSASPRITLETFTHTFLKQENLLPPGPRLVVLFVTRVSYLLGYPTNLKRVIHRQRVAPLPGPAGSTTLNRVWIVDLLITLELWDELLAFFFL